MLTSGHGDDLMAHQDVLFGEGVPKQNKVCSAEDYHAILQAVLQSYQEIQSVGIKFDWMYDGVLCPNTKLFCLFPTSRQTTTKLTSW